MFAEMKKWVIARSVLLMGLLFSTTLWAIDVPTSPMTAPGGGALSQEDLEHLLKYQLFGEDLLKVGAEMKLEVSKGYVGSNTLFESGGGSWVVAPTVLVNGEADFDFDGGNRFDNDVLVKGQLKLKNSNTFTEDLAYTSLTSSASPTVLGMKYSTFGDWPANYQDLVKDTRIPGLAWGSCATNSGMSSLDNSSISSVTDNDLELIDVSGVSSKLVDICLNSISSSHTNFRVLVKKNKGQLIRIFVDGAVSASHDFKMGITEDGTNLIDADDYDGSLLVYANMGFDVKYDRVKLMGTYITPDALEFNNQPTVIGQLLAKSLTIGNNFNGEAFKYVPFNPPEIDDAVVSVAGGELTEDDTSPRTIEINLDKAATVPVEFEYYFQVHSSPNGEPSPGDASAGDISNTPYVNVVDAGTNNFGVASIAEDGLSTTIQISVVDDDFREDTEVLTLVLRNPSGAVFSNSEDSIVIELNILDNDINTPPTSEDFSFSINEDTQKVFAESDFPFVDGGEGSTDFTYLKIKSLPSRGTLFYDNDNDGNVDVGESIIANQAIAVADISKMKFKPDNNGNGSPYTTFTFAVSDGEDYSESNYTATINVTPINDEPSFTAGGDQDVDEDAGEQTVPAWASNIGPGGGSDEDSQTLTFTVTADDPALFSVKPAIDVATGTLTYTPKNNAFGSTQVTVVLSDDGGTANGGVDSRTRTFNINITSVNDMPSINGPFNISVREGAPIDSLLETLVGTDADIGTDPDESLTYEIVSGNTNNDFALDATSGEFTIANQLDYETTPAYTVTVRVVDAVGASASTTITINVINENDNAPVAVADSYGVNEGATLNVLVGDGVLDNDSDADGDLDVLTAVLVSDVSYGELTLNADGSFTYEHDDTENFADSFTYYATDGDSVSNTVTVTIDINPLNDNSPVLVNLDTVDVSEDVALGTLIETVVATDDDIGDTPVYDIVSGNAEGKFAIDANSGEITVIESLDFETTPFYSLVIRAASGGEFDTDTLVVRVLNVNDNDPVISDTAFTIPESTPVSTVIGTMIASDADGDVLTWSISANPNVTVNNSGAVSIVSQYDFESDSVYTYTVTVDDGTYTASATLTVNVTNVNDNNPVATGETYAVDEGDTLTISAPGLLTNDTDADGDALSVVAGDDVDYGTLTLNANGSFIYIHDDSENFTDSFTYRVTDGSRNSNLVTVIININPLNDNSPILDPLGSVDVSESAAISTLIATASASDADGDAISYAIAGGNSEGKFAIDPSSGEITLIDALDYETTVSYTLTIEATAGGETVSDDLTVHVLNENDNAPELRDTTFTITEITDIGTLIGTILASDADGNPLTWSVSANSKIEILSTGGVRTLELFDYESDSVYTYTVTVEDGVYSVNATLTILVTDVDEIPEIAIGPYYVDENSPAGTLIDSIILVNGVITGTVDFLKVADTTGAEDDGDWFTIDAVTGEIFVAPGASLDYETDSLLTIWAVGTNIHGTSIAQEILIGLRNVNEPPVIAAQNLDLQENSPAGTVIGQVVSSDPENNQSYSLLPGSDARLVISSDGELSLGSGTVDYETETTITVGVIVDDGEFADTAVVTINILDVNEAPVIVSNQLPVLENSPGGTEVGSLSATDPEGQPLTWTVIENDFVEITPDGLVTVKEGANLDYESGVNPVFQAIVTDGVNSDTAIVTLIVGDENEPPVVVTDTLTVPENSEEGTVVGQVEAVDPDSGDVLTYEIVGESPFVISTDGEITVGPDAVLDYESTPFIEVVVKVTDSQGIEVTDTLIVSLENSIEVSKVEIVTVTSEDTTWTRPDTIRTNADELEITWEKDGNSTTDTEILEGDGKILVIRKWKDPTADLIGADTVVVLVNRENPTIRYPFEEPEIPEDRYLIVEKSPGSSEMLPDTADGQLVWPEPILPDTIGGIQVIFVHSEDTVLTALATYIDENLNDAETVIEIQPSLREFADGKPVLNVVTFEYTDPYGNLVQETLYVVLDKTPPVVEIINPADSSDTRTYVIDVDWTVDGRPMQYLLQESLQEGENFVIRSYMDRAGNIGSDTVFITLIPRQRYVLVSMEEPLVSMNQRRIDELYSLNPPEEGERFALSVYNVLETREQELQFGHGSAVREADGEEPYPGLRGAHLGPTLRMEIKVPHIGGYDAAGEPRGGDIRSLVGSDGMVVVPSLSGSSSADDYDTIPVADYVRLHCDEDAFDGLTSQELLDAGLMNTEILVSLNVYDFIGQFVDRITLRQQVSNTAYISDGGLVTFYLELKPDEKGMIRNQNGRSFGTGAYILNGYVRSVSTGLCDTPDMSRGERQDRKENVSTKFGYRRD